MPDQPQPSAIDLIIGERDAVYFAAICELLRHRFGAEAGLTLDSLTQQCGIPNRRTTEHILETRLADLPFAVVSGATGYYRPAKAAEINSYRKSLHSRAVKMFVRQRTVLRKCLSEGFSRNGRDFTDRPSQPEFRLTA